jgi:hypothetical protein
MECERIAYQFSEYIGKRLAGGKAQFAKDELFRNQPRKLATYVPDNDEYQHCVGIYRKQLESKYKFDPGPQYNYVLDVSRFADEAAKAVVQFKAQGVTTLALACDPISIIFLTQAAQSQQWGPEWLLLGVAAQDTDNFGRLYEQDRVDGHMFGMSQLSDIAKVIGPDSEPGRLYQALTGKQIPAGTSGRYYEWTHTFNGLQMAGPGLTPEAVARGFCSLPPGGGDVRPAGMWSFASNPDGSAGCDHTAVDDGREVYWLGDAKAPDGKAGHFAETYGGKRFVNGQWPDETPPIYRKGG